MTPIAASVRIEEAQKRDAELAWLAAVLQRAKRLPPSPEAIFTKAGPPKQRDEVIVAMAKARAKAKKDEKAKRRPKK